MTNEEAYNFYRKNLAWLVEGILSVGLGMAIMPLFGQPGAPLLVHAALAVFLGMHVIDNILGPIYGDRAPPALWKNTYVAGAIAALTFLTAQLFGFTAAADIAAVAVLFMGHWAVNRLLERKKGIILDENAVIADILKAISPNNWYWNLVKSDEEGQRIIEERLKALLPLRNQIVGEIDRLKESGRLPRNSRIESIVVYGSYVWGKMGRKPSDVDCIVRISGAGTEWLVLNMGTDLPIDLLVLGQRPNLKSIKSIATYVFASISNKFSAKGGGIVLLGSTRHVSINILESFYFILFMAYVSFSYLTASLIFVLLRIAIPADNLGMLRYYHDKLPRRMMDIYVVLGNVINMVLPYRLFKGGVFQRYFFTKAAVQPVPTAAPQAKPAPAPEEAKPAPAAAPKKPELIPVKAGFLKTRLDKLAKKAETNEETRQAVEFLQMVLNNSDETVKAEVQKLDPLDRRAIRYRTALELRELLEKAENRNLQKNAYQNHRAYIRRAIHLSTLMGALEDNNTEAFAATAFHKVLRYLFETTDDFDARIFDMTPIEVETGDYWKKVRPLLHDALGLMQRGNTSTMLIDEIPDSELAGLQLVDVSRTHGVSTIRQVAIAWASQRMRGQQPDVALVLMSSGEVNLKAVRNELKKLNTPEEALDILKEAIVVGRKELLVEQVTDENAADPSVQIDLGAVVSFALGSMKEENRTFFETSPIHVYTDDISRIDFSSLTRKMAEQVVLMIVSGEKYLTKITIPEIFKQYCEAQKRWKSK